MRFDASEKSLIKAIGALSLPAIVTNISTPLLGLCDIAIAGHRSGAPFIAALAIGTAMFNTLYWLFGFLRMGTSGLTAQAYGARNKQLQGVLLWRALAIGFGASLLILILSNPLCKLLLILMDVSGETALNATIYYKRVIWGAPAVLCTYSLTGWLLGMQKPVISMTTAILANIINIAVSLILVFIFHWEIEGVATGTLIAQWICFAVTFIWAIIRFELFKIDFSKLADIEGVKRFFSINSDIFLRTLCLIAVTVWFTRMGAEQGTGILAANALLMQFFTIFSYMMDGFAFSAEALTGRWCGAKLPEMLAKTVKLELLAGAVLAALFSVLYFSCGEWLLGILTDDTAVKNIAKEYLAWGATIPIAGFTAFACDGIFIGATATRTMLKSMVAATIVYYILILLLTPLYKNHGLWIAFLCYLLTRGIVLLIKIRRDVLAQAGS